MAFRFVFSTRPVRFKLKVRASALKNKKEDSRDLFLNQCVNELTRRKPLLTKK